MEIHPLAAVFPMMADDELAELAEDIKANGLLHPIIVDGDGLLVDGRNRLRACEIAGVEPRVEQLNGRDARAVIVSANLERRNLSKGQQAMALAMIYPEPEKGGRGKHRENGPETLQFSKQRLSQARAVLRHSRALAEGVLAARNTLDVALKQVEEERQASKSRDAQMAELRTHAPDVAALVDDERLTLEAARAELRERKQQILQRIDAAHVSVQRFVGLAPEVTVIKLALGLSDAELAMVGLERAEFDPLAELPDREITALATAVNDLKRIKKGEKA